ncbi:unnamed protein product [Cyprideis torosa]|uniref:Uncharacterized protein n=1 Tax=Cyprideis torosa TaxID=163714 RepID=A0A7R8WIE6_9CRUS|nr:unnamed protein product [Cyprideis torosa]CAG0898710.1 unnamed protein product [Cyprideis torosa]
MRSLLFTVTGTVVLCAFLVYAQQQRGPRRTAPPQIVADCYSNMSILNRYNRMPMNIQNLIGIIRKVEQSQQGYNWDTGRMAKALLKRFRFDGLYINPGYRFDEPVANTIHYDSPVVEKNYIIWFMGPDGTYEEWPEDVLTTEEECTLHFMLSWSLNDTRRDNEDDRDGEDLNIVGRRKKRSILDSLFPSSNTESKSSDGEKDPNSDHLSLFDDGEELKPRLFSMSQVGTRKEEPDYDKSQYPLEMGVILTPYGTIAAGPMLSGIALGLEKEEIRVQNLVDESRGGAGYGDPIEDETAANALMKNYFVSTLVGDLVLTAVEVTDVPNIPVTRIGVQGVWNSSVFPTEYSLNIPKEQTGYLTQAQVFGGVDGLLMGAMMEEWDHNSLRLSQLLESYYSVKCSELFPLSSGLLMGAMMEEWDHNSLRLSQLLESYYSVKGVQLTKRNTGGDGDGGSLGSAIKYRACDRFELLKSETIVTQAEIRDQALAFGYAYYASGRTMGPDWIENVNTKINREVTSLWSYVSSNDGGMESHEKCPFTAGDDDMPVEPHVDLYILVDTEASSTDMTHISYMLS